MWVLQLHLKRAGKHENLTGEGSAKCIGFLAKEFHLKISTGSQFGRVWVCSYGGVRIHVWNVYKNRAGTTCFLDTLLGSIGKPHLVGFNRQNSERE